MTGLDPDNDVLLSAYDEIVDRFKDISLDSFGMARLKAELNILPSDGPHAARFQPQRA